MGRATLEVALPGALETYVKERVAAGDYSSPGDYICALIREDRERRARQELDRLLLEGLDTKSDAVTSEYLAKLRKEATKRVERRPETA
jgi:putative addiction module CopG family antidote